jgi:C4-dicarboxylate transporter DctM subunit
MLSTAPQPAKKHTIFVRIENTLVSVALFTMAALPLLEMAARIVRHEGIPGAPIFVQHLTFVVAFLGAAIAAREGKLLALASGELVPTRARASVNAIIGSLTALIATTLALASLSLVSSEREAAEQIALGIPTWIVVALMPVLLTVIAWRSIRKSAKKMTTRMLVALPSLLSAAAFALLSEDALGFARGPAPFAAIALVVAAALGLPMFALLGGAAMLFFFHDATPIASVPLEMYRLSASPLFPAIPLLTLGGYVLSAGNASERLVHVFEACFGWIPGGPAIVTTLAFAFFTSFTGASGVTILSMGGLLMPVLIQTGFSQRFALGLLTTAGSIGLLFPPSLPVILYGVSAQTPMDALFAGGFVPGLLLIIAVASIGVVQAVRQKHQRRRFALREAGKAVWVARWDLLLPLIVMVGIFGGFATLTEASALTVAYALVVELVFHRELAFRKNLPQAIVDCATLTGGVLLVLGVAMGLTNYLMDAQVPMQGAAWVQAHVESRVIFLIILNVFLLIVGAATDIYSAILVIVPLITPMASAYGIHPVHLGVIFLTNLQLGYLLPPVGENLFLSSYRFEQPVMAVFRAVLPFLFAIVIVVLLVTFVPALSLTLAEWWTARR